MVKIYVCRVPDQKFGAQTPTNYAYPVRSNLNLLFCEVSARSKHFCGNERRKGIEKVLKNGYNTSLFSSIIKKK